MATQVKEYKNSEEIISLLESRNMNFSSPIRAKRILNENNYFFMKGYSKLLLNNDSEIIKYKDYVDFEDLYRLYSFDKDIKILLFRNLLDIEQKIKATLSNFISEKYGVRESQYLKRTNFDTNNIYLDSALKRIKSQKKIYGTKNVAVKYYLNKYNYVPLWVLTKALTMGAIRDLYVVMKPDDQDRIAREILYHDFPKKRVSTLKNIIGLLVDVRNLCAHDEMLINFEHKRIDLWKLPEHDYFDLRKNQNGAVIQGRKDLFAILISIKYLTNKTTYNLFMQELESKINRLMSKKNCFTKEELLEFMNLPINFYELKQI